MFETVLTLNPHIKDNVIIYGAGQNGIELLRLFGGKYKDIRILAIADRGKTGDLTGIPIIKPEELSHYDKSIAIIISPDKNSAKIYQALTEFGFTNILFYSDFAVCEMQSAAVWKKPDFSPGAEDKIAFVRQNLEDDLSLAVFNAKLNSLYNNENEELKKLVTLPQYFVSDIIRFGENEVFADCGAYDGMTAVEFALLCKDYEKIYSFEPDLYQFTKIKRTPLFETFPDFEIYELGVFQKAATLSFSLRDIGASTITESGEIKIRVISLDEFFKGKKPPTFIKMDIEGAEMSALAGAKGIIEKNRPKLAICAYHGKEHIYDVPFWIKSNFPDYKIYMRQHAEIHETVCYAVCG
jgi:FkbM family methyltransferase